MTEVFISYAREDEGFVDRLQAALEERGRTTWLDRSGIPPTAEWMAEIRGAIEASDDFIFVISPASVASRVCRRELELAESLGKRLVPLSWRQVERDAIPASLAARQWIDFRHTPDFGSALDSLIEGLDSDIEWVRAHTRLLVRAREWQASGEDASFLVRGSDLDAAEARLAGHIGQEPAPTELQREYVVASRHVASRRRRVFLGSLVVGLVGALVLSLWGWKERSRGSREAVINSASRLVESSNQLQKNRGERPELAVWLALEALRRLESVDALSYEADRAVRESLGLLAVPGPRLAHEGPVAAMAYSSDGSRLATITTAGEARLWSMPEGALSEALGAVKETDALALTPARGLLGAELDSDSACVWELETGTRLFCRRHTEEPLPSTARAPDPTVVLGVGFSPYGTHLVTGGLSTVRVWSLPDGVERARFEAGLGPDKVAVSRGGRFAASASMAGTRVFDRSGRSMVLGISDAQGAFALAPNGARLAVADGSRLAVWDVAGRVQRPFGNLPGEIGAMAFANSSGALAAAVGDGSVRVWNVLTTEEMARLPHEGKVKSLLFGPHNEIAVAGDFPFVQIWRPGGGAAARRIHHGETLGSATFSPDGTKLATAGDHRSVRLWDPERRGAPLELDHDGPVGPLAFSGDGRLLAVADLDSIHLWRVPELEEVEEFEFGRGPVRGLALEPNARRLAAYGTDDYLYMWSLEDDERIRLRHPDWVEKAVFSADGERLATAAGSWLNVARAEDREVLLREEQAAKIADLAFSPAGQRVATAGADGQVRVWRVPDSDAVAGSSPVEVVALPQDPSVDMVVFSPDGTLLATAGSSFWLRLWNAADGALVAELEHDGRLHGVAFSQDGNHLATIAADRTLRVWSVPGWREIVRASHSAEPVTVSFQPGGRHLVTGTEDGRAWLWLWRSGDLRAEACSRLTNELSEGECRRLIGRRSCRDICDGPARTSEE